jgi:two-component system sensor histidine kinase HydH
VEPNVERLTAENTRLREALARSVALMQRANQLASLGVLTAAFAHEIRNPLVALRAFAQLLPTRWDDGEFRRDFAHVVVAELDRVEALVREFLSVAHDSARENGSARESDATVDGSNGASATQRASRASLAEVVEAVLPLLRVQARGKEVELVFDPGDPVNVEAEPLRLRQVVMNLVLNAIDATPAGGSIVVTCARGDRGPTPRAVLSVRDSGCGIAPNDLPHIFEPFFTTREHGTGLGLAITHEIVGACGGSIRAENTPGAGATFIVELPAADGLTFAPEAGANHG